MHVDVSTIGIPLNGAASLGVPVAQIVAEALAVKLHDGATIDDVLLQLEVPRRDVQFVLVNGRTFDEDGRLCPGDSVALVGHVHGC